MIECIGPWREETRRKLIELHPDLYDDAVIHFAWIDHDEPNALRRTGWTVWWERGYTILRERNVPKPTGKKAPDKVSEQYEIVRDIVNRSL